jgi:hypothetical protein
MSARGALDQLLTEDEELADLGLQRVYAANETDTPEEDCFAIIRWETTPFVAFRGVAPSACTIWVHDRERTYGRISLVLQRIQQLLESTVHYLGPDDWTLTQADWTGEGPDLFDSGYGTCTRYGGFTVVARYTPS